MCCPCRGSLGTGPARTGLPSRNRLGTLMGRVLARRPVNVILMALTGLPSPSSFGTRLARTGLLSRNSLGTLMACIGLHRILESMIVSEQSASRTDAVVLNQPYNLNRNYVSEMSACQTQSPDLDLDATPKTPQTFQPQTQNLT